MNTKSVNLQYHYAQIDEETGRCVSCFTCTYEIPLSNYILIPDASNDYLDKYYNPSTDLWYIDSDMTIEATEVNEMYHG